jgi:hypothetical protein
MKKGFLKVLTASLLAGTTAFAGTQNSGIEDPKGLLPGFLIYVAKHTNFDKDFTKGDRATNNLKICLEIDYKIQCGESKETSEVVHKDQDSATILKIDAEGLKTYETILKSEYNWEESSISLSTENSMVKSLSQFQNLSSVNDKIIIKDVRYFDGKAEISFEGVSCLEGDCSSAYGKMEFDGRNPHLTKLSRGSFSSKYLVVTMNNEE